MLCGCVVIQLVVMAVFFFSSRRRHTRCSRDWSSDVCSSDLRAMDRRDMDVVREEFVRAAQMAEAAGFDILEIHFAHGYLLASFISPLTNRRSDEYGGSLANRLRFPLEGFDAVRAGWPGHKPSSVRVSAV